MLGLAADIGAIKRFAKDDNTLYLLETDSSFTPLTDGDGLTWVVMGAMKGTKIDPVIDEFIDKGDGGKRTIHEETTESIEVTTTAMQRDLQTRLLPFNVKGRFFQIAVKGNDNLGGSQEAWVFCGKVSEGFSYEIGGEAQFTGLKIVTLNNAAAVTVTLPTQIVAANTLTISANSMWSTGNF